MTVGLSTPRARWAWRIGTGTAGLAMLAALLVGPFDLLTGSVVGSTSASRQASCLPGREVAIMDSPHISSGQAAEVRYNSTPPTSGPHFAFVVAPGIYDFPVPDQLTIHALEHGHVAIQYATDVPAATVAKLTGLAKRYGGDVVLAPYPGLATGIALTAWGRIDLLPGYDEGRITTFVERLRDRYSHGWQRPDDCPG